MGEELSDRTLRWLAWLVLILILTTLASPIFFIRPEEGITIDFVVGLALSGIILALAFWLTLKVPRNSVTWVLLLSVSCALVAQASFDYVNSSFELSLPLARVAFALQLSVFWISIGLGIVTFPLLFPTGRPPTSRWWWVAWVALAAVMTQIVGAVYLAVTLPLDALIDDVTGIGWLDAAVFIGQGLVVAAAVAALVSMIVRFARSSGTERQQLKWMLFPLSFGALFWISESLVQDTPLATVFLVAMAATLPIAIGMSILKYRLYDIDRIISRTVSYALVVGLLAAVFFGVVAFITALLGAQDDLAIAASTLAVAALFNPLRKRVQGLVDHRFNRSRYDTERVMEEFTGTLQDQVDPDGVVDGWVDVVSETMQPSALSVWVRDPSSR